MKSVKNKRNMINKNENELIEKVKVEKLCIE